MGRVWRGMDRKGEGREWMGRVWRGMDREGEGRV